MQGHQDTCPKEINFFFCLSNPCPVINRTPAPRTGLLTQRLLKIEDQKAPKCCYMYHKRKLRVIIDVILEIIEKRNIESLYIESLEMCVALLPLVKYRQVE